MKTLKYLLALLFFFGLFSEIIQASPIKLIGSENTCTYQVEFSANSEETNWLGLLYLKENDKLATHPNRAGLSLLDLSLDFHADLVDSWKKLDDLGADEALRRNPEALEYLSHGRSDKILLDVEELLGGHSKARHGFHLSMTEMEQRVLGTHPTMPQSRSALKFDSDAIHEASVNKAFKEHKAEIEAHFASGGGYKEWDSQLNGRIGEGYHNTGTRNNPASSYVTTDKVKIAFDADPTSPSGYKMISAYPWYEIP